MRIHQIVPSEGIEQLVLARALRPLFKSLDLNSDIYAHKAFGDIQSLSQLFEHPSKVFSDGVVILHRGAVEVEVIDLLHKYAQNLVVLGLETTKPDQFLWFDPSYAGRLRATSTLMPMLAERAQLAIGFSKSEASALSAIGFDTVVVSPFIVNVDSVINSHLHQPTINHFETKLDGNLIFTSGLIEPNWRNHLQIQAYHLLVTYLMPRIHLAISGRDSLINYSKCLEHEINELNLNRAWMAGDLDDSELTTYLHQSSAYLSTRSDRGNWTGIMQAMALGVPVVTTETLDMSALPQNTMIVLPSESGPELIAEALFEVHENVKLRQDLIQNAKAFIADYDYDSALATLLVEILGAIK